MVLLCTDGLHHMVAANELKQTVLDHAGYPQDAVDELIAQAIGKGERDDITAVLMELPPGTGTTVTAAGKPPTNVPLTTAAASNTRQSNSLTTASVVLALLAILVLIAIYWLLR